ncbi:hypothetical protein ABN069_20175 [Providencia rettgeri]|uniref:hypothetical protein n=1 Tax=Proteus TaxID=583 RepID=UPI0018C7ACAD|nr:MULTISPECIES: hypothetical protein [Proteus]MBG3006042.1 hypothetical protein [Proteus mirabilis]MBG3085219.1 hypothetical protein [Proteus mirabilis]MBG3086200.1 hypothetical protein [Proteus mirabilis]MBG5947242.1 hypothetical protein [Proteus mirabilis]MDC5890820.1 hypothetical protein [Proteus mirabilis]
MDKIPVVYSNSYPSGSFLKNVKDSEAAYCIVHLLGVIENKSKDLIVRGAMLNDGNMIIRGMVNHAIEKTLCAMLHQYDCNIANEDHKRNTETMADVILNGGYDKDITDSIIGIISGIKINEE